MLVGIVLFAVGTGLYAAADLGRGSYEAVTFALAEKNHWQVKVVRMILDAAMVVIGVILGGKFGVCTVVTVIVSGPIIQFPVGRAKRIIKLYILFPIFIRRNPIVPVKQLTEIARTGKSTGVCHSCQWLTPL